MIELQELKIAFIEQQLSEKKRPKTPYSLAVKEEKILHDDHLIKVQTYAHLWEQYIDQHEALWSKQKGRK